MIYNNGTPFLADIKDVGCPVEGRGIKMIGYKTLGDLTKLCGLDEIGISMLKVELETRGLKVLALTGEECSMKSGALYVYAQVPLQFFLMRHKRILQENDWTQDAEGFVRKLAVEWTPWNTPLRRVIDIAFANFDHEKSMPDLALPCRPVAERINVSLPGNFAGD